MSTSKPILRRGVRSAAPFMTLAAIAAYSHSAEALVNFNPNLGPPTKPRVMVTGPNRKVSIPVRPSRPTRRVAASRPRHLAATVAKPTAPAAPRLLVVALPPTSAAKFDELATRFPVEPRKVATAYSHSNQVSSRNSPEVLNHLHEILLSGDWDWAARAFKATKHLLRQYDGASNELGNFAEEFNHDGNFPAAEIAARWAYELDPGNGGAALEYQRALAFQDDIGKAREAANFFRVMQKNGWATPETYVYQSKAQALLGKFAEANKSLDIAQRGNASYVDFTRGEVAFAQAETARPYQKGSLYLLALSAYERAGEKSRMLNCYLKLAEISPQSADGYIRAAARLDEPQLRTVLVEYLLDGARESNPMARQHKYELATEITNQTIKPRLASATGSLPSPMPETRPFDCYSAFVDYNLDMAAKSGSRGGARRHYYESALDYANRLPADPQRYPVLNRVLQIKPLRMRAASAR